ncbi:inhibin alpha chain [Rhinoraja longicauda]
MLLPPCTTLARRASRPLVLLLSLSLLPWAARPDGGCSTHSLSGDAIVAKFQGRILHSLGLSHPPESCNRSGHQTRNPFANPRLERQLTHWIRHHTHSRDEEKSDIISFPITSVPCDVQHEEFVGDHSYIFRLSQSPHRRLVTSAELWFHTGLPLAPPGGPLPELFFLVDDSFVGAAESVELEDQWVAFRIAQPLLRHLAHSAAAIFLQVKCPWCPCVGEDRANLPFLLSSTKPAAGPGRSRRSTVPWSPAYVNLLQRPPSPELIHDDCQRSAVNISFEELGWGNWIVQPRAFTFYYCNGTCSNSNRLTSSLGLSVCCTSVPGTMKPLRVRTTSDSGYTFKYETIPNIITRECACI